jgi:hypothetical protein
MTTLAEIMEKGDSMAIVISLKDGGIRVIGPKGEVDECHSEVPPKNTIEQQPFKIYVGPGSDNCVYICGLFGCRKVCLP